MTHFSAVKNTYRIDRNDRLIYLGGDWDRFAITNEAPELTSQDVSDLSLWDFISGDLVRHIYSQMIEGVRSGRSFQFDFRCDSPDTRRFLEMRITPASNGGVQFETVIKQEEERPSPEILRRSPDADGEIVISCSWCNKIKTGEDVWHEVEQATEILKLLELDPSPQLSHGMCSSCFEIAMKAIAAR